MKSGRFIRVFFVLFDIFSFVFVVCLFGFNLRITTGWFGFGSVGSGYQGIMQMGCWERGVVVIGRRGGAWSLYQGRLEIVVCELNMSLKAVMNRLLDWIDDGRCFRKSLSITTTAEVDPYPERWWGHEYILGESLFGLVNGWRPVRAGRNVEVVGWLHFDGLSSLFDLL